MTKKILVTNHNVKPREFLAPIKTNNSYSFAGLSSGKTHTTGTVVYCGVEVNYNLLNSKAIESNMKLKRELIKKYITQIPNFKIGKQVKIKDQRTFEIEYV